MSLRRASVHENVLLAHAFSKQTSVGAALVADLHKGNHEGCPYEPGKTVLPTYSIIAQVYHHTLYMTEKSFLKR